jgi:DNA polymerase-3 subunit delta'
MAATIDTDEIDPWAPRRNPNLIGHQAAVHALARAAESGRLPHAILLAGPRGIGKATLAFRFARWLLARPADAEGLFGLPPHGDLAIDANHPVARRIAANGHADLLTVERAWDPKRKRLKGEIVVDDVRAVAGFFHLTASEGGWRIVIIDGADEMNRNAANALLKILEEPPKGALLLLVCHAVGRMLPTIRSRCRTITLQTLAEDEVILLLQQHRPALSSDDAVGLARLAEGSIGRALELADAGGIPLYRAISGLIGSLPQLDVTALYQLADSVARGEDDAYRTLLDLLLDFVTRLAVGAAEEQPRAAFPGEETLLLRLGQGRVDRWITVWESLNALFRRADAVNLDRKQVVLDAFFTLEAASR